MIVTERRRFAWRRCVVVSGAFGAGRCMPRKERRVVTAEERAFWVAVMMRSRKRLSSASSALASVRLEAGSVNALGGRECEGEREGSPGQRRVARRGVEGRGHVSFGSVGGFGGSIIGEGLGLRGEVGGNGGR